MEADKPGAESARIILGYHATSLDQMTSILKTQKFVMSKNSWDWLGHGVYFWEGPGRAVEWAKAKFSNAPAVVVAKIRLGICLDLCDSGYWDVVRLAYERLEGNYKKIGKELPENKGKCRTRDCMVFNYLASEILPVDTLRSPFMEGAEIYPGTELRARQHIQLCVRNLECIFEISNYK